MPKNIIVDNLAFLQALAAFILTFSIFLVIMIRAWKMRQGESDHMANLPLNDDDDTEAPKTTPHPNKP